MLSLVLYAGRLFALDSLTLLATLVGEKENDEFIACASAGDVNGDGFKDIIIGATQAMMDRGYAYVYLGGPDFDTIPDVRLIGEPFSPSGFSNFGCLTACAGDVNNDGYDDVMVSANFGFNYDIGWGRERFFCITAEPRWIPLKTWYSKEVTTISFGMGHPYPLPGI